MEQCMVFSSSAEKQDEANPESVVKRSKESIVRRLNQVKVKDLMISSLCPSHLCPQVLKGIKSALASEGYKVKRAPFGWHKEFELKAKGHLMAEQLLSIGPNEGDQDDIIYPYLTVKGRVPSPQPWQWTG